MMKRTVYEAPITEHFLVEQEGVFCASADIQNPNNENGKIDDHQVNTGFTSAGDFSDEGWD